MSIMDRVKNHISDNRGKYGVAAGVSGLAASQYAIENAPSMVNTAIYNAAAKGQNLALDTADKIGYGKEQLKNLGLENKIRQEDIDAGNDFYNSEIGQMINPSPLKMVNAAESSSELYNKVQEAKAQSQDVVQQAKAQFGNAYENGINYIKSLNPFNENTISIPIKAMLLEGYQPEEITEGIIRDTFNKYKKPIVAGAMAGFIGATGNNIYQGSFSPTAQHHNKQIEIATKNIPALKEYSHLSTKQLDDHLNEKYKNDPAGKVKLAGEILSDKPTMEALSAKNKHVEGINNQYLKRDLPLGILGGSLAIGGLVAGMRRKSK